MFQIDELKSLIETLYPKFSVHTSEDLLRGDFGPPSDSRRVIISPLNELVFMTKRVRQMIYSEASEEILSGASLDSKVKKFLEISKTMIAKDLGSEASEEWQSKTYAKIRSIIAAEGPHGIFNGPNSVVSLVEMDMKQQFEIKEKLILPYGIGDLEIARRTVKYGISHELMENWDINNGAEDLFESIMNIHNQIKFSENHRTYHVYFWADQSLGNYQPSMIKQVLEQCFYDFNSGLHSVFSLLLITTQNESHEQLPKLSDREFLSLQRSLNNGRIFLSPSYSEDIFTNPQKRMDRPNSVFTSKFMDDAVKRTQELKLTNMRLLDSTNIVIESTNDLPKLSSIAVLNECWNGTWSKSLEVDGEQVII